MAQMKYEHIDYGQADGNLLVGRNAESLTLGNNTVLHRTETKKGGPIAIRLHNTDIVTLIPDGSVVLNSGGWLTPTTKDRMSSFLPIGWSIYSERGTWILWFRGFEWDKDNPAAEYVFADGVTIGADHRTVTGAGKRPDPKLLKSINAYAKRYARLLVKGMVHAPDNGDCLYCRMRTVDTDKSLGEATGDTSHLKAHLTEGYLVPSLLRNAVEAFPVSIVANNVITAAWRLYPDTPEQHEQAKGVLASTSWTNIAQDQIESSIRRYLRRQFGIAA